ncbi:MAG: site-specific integrase, partial [Firmicutes bacterium]|nr:site-specific integrase [Bacillota bacterium]
GVTALTQEQVTMLLEATRQTRFHIPVLLAVAAGLRRGEVLGLTWDAVDLGARKIRIQRTMLRAKDGEPVWGTPKTERSHRTVVLPATVAAELEEHRRRQELYRQMLGGSYRDYGLVVCLEDGRAWDVGTFDHSFRRMVDMLGFRGLRFHDLRHTHATLLLEAGVHPKVVQERLGHSQIAVTMDTYTHVLPTIQDQAAEALDRMLFGRVANRTANGSANIRGRNRAKRGASGREQPSSGWQ